MTREERCENIQEAMEAIDFQGIYDSHERYGSGHINDTFVLNYNLSGRRIRYILQRMNHEIFQKPEQLMNNIFRVTEFLKKKIRDNQGDVNRESMNIVYTKEGETFYLDRLGSYWRAYQFIEGATSYDAVKDLEDFYQSALAFGHFQNLLADFPADILYETIPDFHNTPVRLERFKKAVKEDICGRASAVTKEISFFLEHEADMTLCSELYSRGELPLRVTHNDTKLNNIMIDDVTGRGICVIDLDTVMPGLSIYDFGDSIRFGANTACEDETDLTKVSLDLELYEAFTEGFLEGCNGSLTCKEMELLPMGAKLMTLECGMRFLTDYLQGDTYFLIHRELHNLDRCRTQIELVTDMERKWQQMEEITRKYNQKAFSLAD